MAVAEYDYIVVGAGTAGLSLATRLAQADKSVLVLEAGKDSSEAAEINVPGFFMKNIGHPDRDWAFFSQPQTHANSRAVFLPRGKGVGGTSVLNFIQWNRASAPEYDALETLGLEGWNWQNLLHYFKKSETLVAPESAQEATLLKLDPAAHGTSGPIIVAPPTQISSVHLPFLQGFKELGFPTNYDSSDGDNIGAWTSLANIDPADATRSSSASVYLKLKSSLPHLEVIPSALVARIVFADEVNADGLVTATGVEYIKDGEKRFAKATKEVIVSGGAYQTPQVLELSGIGNKVLLEKHGIQTVVDLPGVGENLREHDWNDLCYWLFTVAQEHIYVPTAFELKEGLESWDELQNPQRLEEEIKKYYSEKKGMLTTLPYSYGYIPWQAVTPEAEVRAAVDEALKDSGEAFPSVAKTWALQRDLLDNPAVAALEIMQAANYHPAVGITPEPGKVHCSIGGLLQRAFSRGSVHIQSSDPLAAPAIDPQFLSEKADLTLLVDSVRFIRKLVQTEGYKSALTREVAPGPAVQTQEELEKYVIDNFQTVFHPVSTATMLPREDGGVVDANLKVYGTANVWVADASVIPLHIAAHPQSTVYAIAEKAADIILQAASK